MTAGHSYPKHDWLLVSRQPSEKFWRLEYHTKRPQPPANAATWRIETLREGVGWVEVERGVR